MQYLVSLFFSLLFTTTDLVEDTEENLLGLANGRGNQPLFNWPNYTLKYTLNSRSSNFFTAFGRGRRLTFVAKFPRRKKQL
jgi:hypothetical protein